MQVVGNQKGLKKLLKKMNLDERTEEAVKIYLSTGGVIKIEDYAPFKIIYPSKNRLLEVLSQTEEKEKYISNQLLICKKELDKIATNNFSTTILKISNPKYWQHIMQSAVNSKYKKHFDKVDLPMEMMHVPRYKKIIEMFITNPEYRERLVEARTSELGKIRDSIRESAVKAEDFKKKAVNATVSRLEKEHAKLKSKINAIKVLISASGRFF